MAQKSSTTLPTSLLNTKGRSGNAESMPSGHNELVLLSGFSHVEGLSRSIWHSRTKAGKPLSDPRQTPSMAVDKAGAGGTTKLHHAVSPLDGRVHRNLLTARLYTKAGSEGGAHTPAACAKASFPLVQEGDRSRRQ